MIVDISLNEMNIGFIDSTAIQFGLFYPQVENTVVEECTQFYDEIRGYLRPSDFAKITNLHFSELRSIFPKTTQKKLHDLMFDSQVKY
mmetsp:Transcript_20387/g.23551  ORF Transcript_20387/g.23551 Transcript_20387/m.23551 type:complete len:88 (-) Transcript_20387:806-1069(-)